MSSFQGNTEMHKEVVWHTYLPFVGSSPPSFNEAQLGLDEPEEKKMCCPALLSAFFAFLNARFILQDGDKKHSRATYDRKYH